MRFHRGSVTTSAIGDRGTCKPIARTSCVAMRANSRTNAESPAAANASRSGHCDILGVDDGDDGAMRETACRGSELNASGIPSREPSAIS